MTIEQMENEIKNLREELEEELKTLRVELEKNSKELRVYKRALVSSCWLLSMSSECFNGYCPLEKTISDKRYGFEGKHCPNCNNENVWQEYFIQKARAEE